MRLGLIADDVTGAGDASVQFAKRGWNTFLSLHLSPTTPLSAVLGSDPGTGTGDRPWYAEQGVIAVTTDARALGNDAARTLTHDVLARLMADGIDRVFLKIDSTMRGSVPGQIAGAIEAWKTRHPGARAIVCPAYPRMGRTVQSGRLLVNGEHVDRTAIGRDPVTPVTTSDMHALVPASPSIEIADADSDAALAAIAASIASEGPSVIAVGSGGLAEALADALAQSIERDSRPQDGARRVAGRVEGPHVLLLVTSLNPASHAQAARLRHTLPDVEVLLAPAERVGNTSVAERLADEFAARVTSKRWDLVGLVGGDGARAALSRLGASGIRIVDSLVEGIPLGVIVGGAADGLPVFTKAGGFGADDALVRAVERVYA